MKTGIVHYGVAIPKHRIDAGEIWKTWKNLAESFFDLLSIGERGVLGPEEDTLTLATAAAVQALSRSEIAAEDGDASFRVVGIVNRTDYRAVFYGDTP